MHRVESIAPALGNVRISLDPILTMELGELAHASCRRLERTDRDVVPVRIAQRKLAGTRV